MATYKRFGRHLGGLFTSSASRNSRRVSPAVARVARRGDMPDAGTYERPNTTRISSANLWLSIIAVAGVGIAGLLLLHIVL